jgi:ribosome-associated toxin RatA of RatAB toxin-antitoxin module
MKVRISLVWLVCSGLKREAMSTLARILDRIQYPRRLFLITPLLLFSNTLAAGPVSEVAVTRLGEGYLVQVRMEVMGHQRLTWQVLTDYENLPLFVPGMLSSRIVSRNGDPMLLEQKGESGVLFFRVVTKTVSRIVETPQSEIRFDLVSGNLKRMQGSWTLIPHDHATIVNYRAELTPELPLPPLIGPAVMSQNVKTMVEGVAREIERRYLSLSKD